MPLSLTTHGSVALITWDEGENRINLDSLNVLHSLLDEVESVEGPLALVWTGRGKFFSNGLDLDRFGDEPAELRATLASLHRTVARLLLFPAYTVAALNGHAFAGGALLSCAVDYRLMRADRGYWCMNELDIGFPLDEKLVAILLNRLPRASALDAMMTARRFSAPEALTAGIVQEVSAERDLVERALAVAEVMAVKNRSVLVEHKRLVYGDLAAFLEGTTQ